MTIGCFFNSLQNIRLIPFLKQSNKLVLPKEKKYDPTRSNQ